MRCRFALPLAALLVFLPASSQAQLPTCTTVPTSVLWNYQCQIAGIVFGNFTVYVDFYREDPVLPVIRYPMVWPLQFQWVGNRVIITTAARGQYVSRNAAPGQTGFTASPGTLAPVLSSLSHTNATSSNVIHGYSNLVAEYTMTLGPTTQVFAAALRGGAAWGAGVGYSSFAAYQGVGLYAGAWSWGIGRGFTGQSNPGGGVVHAALGASTVKGALPSPPGPGTAIGVYNGTGVSSFAGLNGIRSSTAYAQIAARWTTTFTTNQYNPSTVAPEPTTVVLFGTGLLGVGLVTWRRRRGLR